jgi:hypothetical protein
MFAPITPKPKSQSTRHNVKQDWEKLYRAAIIESDRSKVPKRIENTEAAIRKRSRRLSKIPAHSEKEREAITRALHILSLLLTRGRD